MEGRSVKNWDGKVALVTGGSSGLGYAIAEAFASHGARVIISARDRERLNLAAQSIEECGAEVTALPADVTDPQQVEQMCQQAMAVHNRLDVWVNNVGISSRGFIADTTAEDFQKAFELNFLSAVHCTRVALPHLLHSGGHLVNIGSLASKTVGRFLGSYPASKFALAAYTSQLRLELRDQGVHVLLVCPGPIRRKDSGHRYDEMAKDLPDSARRPGGGVQLKGIAAADVAARIVTACEHRRAELVIPGRTRWLFALSQLSPRLGDWLVNRYT